MTLSGWWRNWWTAHRLRMLLQYGWCPKCRSSPPDPTCTICVGNRSYGPRISLEDQGMWAHRYVRERAS